MQPVRAGLDQGLELFVLRRKLAVPQLQEQTVRHPSYCQRNLYEI